MSAPKIDLKSPIQFIASGFGSGSSPIAPGTMGTVMAIPLWMLFSLLSPPLYIGMLIITTLFGIYICGAASKELGVHDHGGIVWDEFVGYWITMFLIPLTFWNIVIGFLLFRLFDILKPWTISAIDRRVKGGFGIMIDDIIAGLFALLCFHIGR